MRLLLLLADGAFWIFHTALVGFNVFGWMWPKVRRWNLICLGLTAASWLIMGMWKGVGYCVCTDLHFQVREALGIRDGASSYLQLMAFKFSGWWPSTELVNLVAGTVFLVSVVASVVLNLRDSRSKLRSQA